LWDDGTCDYHDILDDLPVSRKHRRARTKDLDRDIWATIRFWGLAYSIPMALTAALIEWTEAAFCEENLYGR
tara:strand:- start:10534 stop:10749 length:216 start_codon:yes stop_codon:yes gene_type:complete